MDERQHRSDPMPRTLKTSPAVPRRFLSACRALAAVAALASMSACGAEPVAAGEEASAVGIHQTRVARSFTLLYQMHRGGISGSGELVWKRTGDQYEAHLKGTVAGFAVLNWNSSGGFDAAGVAPARYLERRLGKSDREAVFRRDVAKIDFSGVSPDVALLPGTQDRVSWLVQLPAILAAEPARAQAGARVAMHVVGTRGRSEVWSFVSSGAESIRTPSGTVRAVKLVRESQKADDTRAEVWVDPARQYLPAQIRLALPPFDAPLELSLADASY